MKNSIHNTCAECVEISDLGELHWLLGMEIKRDCKQHTLHLSQRSYIDSIIRRYHPEDLKPVSTPVETHIRLSTSQSPSTAAEVAQMRDIHYHEAIGSLMYAVLGTRPGPAHWEAATAAGEPHEASGVGGVSVTGGGGQNPSIEPVGAAEEGVGPLTAIVHVWRTIRTRG